MIDIFRSLFFSLKLTHFEKFDDTTQALAAATATVEGKISKPLKKLLKRLVDPDVQDKLLVADSALGKAIKVCFLNKYNIYMYIYIF
jgi:nucleolar protein 58